MFFIDTDNLFNFGYFLIGAINIGIYIFENSRQYLIIQNGVITKNGFQPKSLKLDEIKHIRDFAGDYILKTEQDELTITKSFIEENSLLDLEKVLNALDLKTNDTLHMPSKLP